MFGDFVENAYLCILIFFTMAQLLIRDQEKSLFQFPHSIFIDNQFVGIIGRTGSDQFRLTNKKMNAIVNLPEGTYSVRIQSLIPFISSSADVSLTDSEIAVFDFASHEFWWDILFWIDFFAWLVFLFVKIPSPYNLIYHIVSDVAFAIWLIHEFRIRKNYFQISVSKIPVPMHND